MTASCKPVTVYVRHVDSNEDDPGLNYIVSLGSGSGFSIPVAAYDEVGAANQHANDLAVRNHWSCKLLAVETRS